MQKDVSLELAPGKLITSKFFSIVRHPNYLGELLIYASFVGLSDSVFFNAHLALLVATYWVPCMWWKEQSMSRYDEWKKYAQDTKAIIPFLL